MVLGHLDVILEHLKYGYYHCYEMNLTAVANSEEEWGFREKTLGLKPWKLLGQFAKTCPMDLAPENTKIELTSPCKSHQYSVKEFQR